MSEKDEGAAPPQPHPKGCVLNGDDCLSLDNIVSSFNSPINEEHAWAICYQCAKCAFQCVQDDPLRNTESARKVYSVSDMVQVFIHKDGNVHPSTFTKTEEEEEDSQEPGSSESKIVSSLGLVIFQALDYGLREEEERQLSSPLEGLIELMTSADAKEERPETPDDEGIEQDEEPGPSQSYSDDSARISLKQIIKACAEHLSEPGQADNHYKAVCRALVTEALDLSSFLETVKQQGTEELRRHTPHACSDLDQLHFSDWAKLWVQVIRELRQGVKLKKVEPSSPTPIEFELTPYEILMDDIRSRRYKLNSVREIPPRVKKDAHAVILEFIRSRPPLKRAQDRKLPPPPQKQSNVIDKLLESIRRKDARLKPVQIKKRVETSRTRLVDNELTPQPHRRLIKADLSLAFVPTGFDDDDDLESELDGDEDDDEVWVDRSSAVNGSTGTGASDGRSSPGSRSSSPVTWHKEVARDLAIAGSGFKPERRHSISVCESPGSGPQSQNTSGQITPQSMSMSPVHGANTNDPLPPAYVNATTSLQTSLLNSTLWRQSVDCLSLTLEEVMHIRSVLTKAELETLLFDPKLYKQVSKGKICFGCRKTRFRLLGQWGHKCRLCAQVVCQRCCTRMRIPTEHFTNIPVSALSPSTPSPCSDEEATRNKKERVVPSWPSASSILSRLPDIPKFQNNSAGSAPNSPNLPRSDSRHSTPSQSSSQKETPTESSKASSASSIMSKERACHLRGILMTVCLDCATMVKQIIHSSHVVRRRRTSTQATAGTQRRAKLQLNLNPVY